MIKLIKKVKDLDSTCYFELLPGVYQNKCWNAESVFIHMIHWDYIEPIIAKHVDNYDHFSFMSVDKNTWKDIIAELIVFREKLEKSQNIIQLTNSIDFRLRDSDGNFTNDFESSKNDLAQMIKDLGVWLRKITKQHNKIAILGM